MIGNSIARRVANAINNAQIDPAWSHLESIACRAAWDEQGANVERIIRADREDDFVMREKVLSAAIRASAARKTAAVCAHNPKESPCKYCAAERSARKGAE